MPDDPFESRTIRQRIQNSVRMSLSGNAHELTFQALGTRCRASYAGPAPVIKAFPDLLIQWIAGFEAKYSRFWPHSLISRINASAGSGQWIPVDADADKLFALCHQMVFFTQGVFDPTALPLVSLWDWKNRQTHIPIPTREAIAQAQRLVGWKRVDRQPGKLRLPAFGMKLDLGGIGKEFAVDQSVALAQSIGMTSILIDYGADVRVAGPPPDGRPRWYIGLEDPTAPGQAWGGVAIVEGAVATSGDYVRKFEINGRRFGHILDIRTGEPVDNGTRAVSVVAPNCTMAGMVSTTGFILGREKALRLMDSQMGVAGVVVSENSKAYSQKFHEYIIAKQ